MAKLHSRKKGKSGSKRPKSAASLKAVEIPKEQVEEMVLKSVREGMPQARIGLMLRDTYAVPSVKAVLGIGLSEFLKKKHSLPEYPDDLLNLIKKAVRVRNHLRAAKKDIHNKVKLLHIESKIQRLVKYYAQAGRLPSGWKYDAEKAALLVK